MKRIFLCLALLLYIMPAFAQEYIEMKGDLHCHSNFSADSDVPTEDVIEAYVSAGYDFIALTEHNTVKHLRKDWSTDKLLVLPGYELTLSAGHYNVFGVREFKRKFDMNQAELAEYFIYLKELGALVQLDHPNAQPYASRYGYALDFDMLEVANGAITADDLKTLEDYQTLLAQGRRIIAIGNTDAHRDHANKQLHNLVLATQRSQEAVLAALAAGRTSVRLDMAAPRVMLTCDSAVMGETVKWQAGQAVTIEVSGLKSDSDVRVYTKAGATRHVPDADPYTLTVDTMEAGFVRAEIWRGGMPQTISNPIYIDP